MNIHNPTRYPEETQSEYRMRRALSRRVVETLCHPDRGAGKQTSRELFRQNARENRLHKIRGIGSR